MLNFNVSKATNMNVYIYAGRDRFSATQPIVEGNNQPELGKLYTVQADKGILVVAYPSMNVDTDF